MMRDRGEVSITAVLLVIVLALAAVWLFLAIFDGPRDHDGKKGLDWERHPVAKSFETSH